MQWLKTDHGFIVDNEDYKLSLSFQQDDLELRGDIQIGRGHDIISVDELVNLLNSLGLKGKIELKNAQMFCAAAAEGKPLPNVLLMHGSVPVAGTHGRLEIVHPETRKGDGRVEAVVNVLSGQTVATIVPSTAGVAGTTLTGKMIPARAGVAAKIRLGNGVEWAKTADAENGVGDIIANADGRVVHDVMTGTLSVLDTLVIEGNVNQRYGDLDFVGTIEIHGDVESGHAIKAGKGIKISGNVESSLLDAGGDIEIGGGVAGKEKGMIKSGGNVSMRYLDSCRLECRGSLTVRNEIVDSIVYSGGCVDVTNGSIIGGKIEALGGIEAKVFGSEVGIRTVLITGANFIAERDIEALEDEEHAVTVQLEEISRKLDHYIKNPAQLSRLTDDERLELRRMTGEFTRMNHHLLGIPGQITAIRETMGKNANPMVNAGKMIAKGVEINIGIASVVISETIRKSVTVVKNSITDGFRYINRIRLVDNAVKVERDIAVVEMQKVLQQQK